MNNSVNLTSRLIRLEDYSEIQKFDCGNTSIENFLKQDAYYLTIMRECSTTLVFYQSDLIGYFSLRKSTLKVEIDDELINFPCLDIARIAVHKDFQGKGYGTYLLHSIFKLADTVSERFITLEALIERFEWYSCHGFNALIDEEAQKANPDGLVFMVADLLDQEVINQYFDE